RGTRPPPPHRPELVSDPSVSRRLARSRRRGEFGVRITNLRQIGRARTRVQVLEHAVAPFLFLELVDLAVRIVHVAEDDRVCRTGGAAGRNDLAVAHAAGLST